VTSSDLRTDHPTPTLGRRERNKRQTRLKILAAASTLFARHGVAETTIDQIADLADVSDTTVYNYFTSKDELVDAFLMETNGAHGFAALLAARPSKEGPLRALRGLFEDVDADDVLSNEDLKERRALLQRVREDKLLWGAYLRTIAEAATRLQHAFEARAPKWEPGEALVAAHAALGVLQAVLDLQDDDSTFQSYRADSVAALKRLERAFPH
jgi:AcrR family transcriptional regulator